MYINFTSPTLEEAYEERMAKQLQGVGASSAVEKDGGRSAQAPTPSPASNGNHAKHTPASPPRPVSPMSSVDTDTLEIDFESSAVSSVQKVRPGASPAPAQPVAAKKAPERRTHTTAHDTPTHLGYVTFDGTNRANASCDLFVTPTQAIHFHRDIYVGIEDADQGIGFLGRITAGPFYGRRNRQQDAESGASANDSQQYSAFGTVE